VSCLLPLLQVPGRDVSGNVSGPRRGREGPAPQRGGMPGRRGTGPGVARRQSGIGPRQGRQGLPAAAPGRGRVGRRRQGPGIGRALARLDPRAHPRGVAAPARGDARRIVAVRQLLLRDVAPGGPRPGQQRLAAPPRGALVQQVGPGDAGHGRLFAAPRSGHDLARHPRGVPGTCPCTWRWAATTPRQATRTGSARPS
jgi:hypothetical protein